VAVRRHFVFVEQMKRIVTPELLDAEGWTAPELGVALGDLDRINRWFGGIGTMVSMLEQVARRRSARELSMLDVGGAGGDLARDAAGRLRHKGVGLNITVADRAASHLDRGLPGVASDATALPFRDNSFDVVGCSLLAHHLDPEQVQRFGREALRVCRAAVLINDLRRSPVHLALVYAGFPLFRSPLTRNDGPASVRAAYMPEEIRKLLKDLPAAIEITNHYLYRMAVILWKTG
jgi:ubiquinone/menaquinone biosynthesis C-methylase UbiE